ncbi:hypothetical protein ALT_5347 [Aspergillus lentulus]|uniref:Uncharacterized protein n=1 Tax=Aspergillus lentulus TaxID=293939 RepID=A0AAN4PKH0_ASPLE|nr:hypothetical protein ALT_5347 [Aspergillus lentulus]
MTRRDMSEEALKAKRSAIINHLQQLRGILERVNPPNFGIDELCELGLKPVRVELTPDKELLEFEPCFFLPQPTSVLLEHPFSPEEREYDIEHGETYATILDDILEWYPNTENPEEKAREQYERAQAILREDGPDWLSNLEHLEDHIGSHLGAWRSGFHTSRGEGFLEDLTPLKFCWDRFSEIEGYVPRVRIDPGGKIGKGYWTSCHVFIDKSAGMPHTIICFHVEYCGNDTSLTMAEVYGLLHHMYQWYTLREFRQHAIGPLQVPIKKVDLENMAKAFKTNKPFSRNFEAYLQSIKDESDTSGKLGVFQGTRKCQLEADQRIPKGDAGEMSTSVRMSRTPDPESQEGRTPAESITATSESNATPAAEQEWLQSFVQTPDEQCVNMALISFLDAVSLNLPDYKCKWGIARLAFKVDFHRASMKARTDGYLYGPTGGDEAFAIVETKAHQRKKTTKTGGQVYMQESAEMVAWILKDESEERKVPLDNQRLLVAQDREEIYLVWASYDASYVDYLEGKPTSGNVFMTMNEIGPFKTQDDAHMRQLAEYIGCFCSQITARIERSSQT